MLVDSPPMRESLSIGVVGCGTAGAAAALFLARAGHRVSVFEHVEDPRPVGAGIMLQPTGQDVLARLGLHEAVVSRGERIDRLSVQTGSGRRLLALSYADVSPRFFGVGLHRGVLFGVLFDAVRKADLSLHLGVSGENIRRAGKQRILVDKQGDEHGPFDLLVIADGAKSRFRDDTNITLRADAYPWGALWFMAEDPEHLFKEELFQVVEGTGKLIGLLPTGQCPEGRRRVSVFYSVRGDAVDAVRRMKIADFRAELVRYAPKSEAIVGQIEDTAQLLYSGYMDVVMSPWHTRAVVHLGDSAHAMSPQLGQGANLALYDAWVLAECVATQPSVAQALEAYTRARRAHLGYYQVVTRGLTPFFQSDHAGLGLLRDLFMPIMNRVPAFNRAMVIGMCGIADGHPWKQVPVTMPGE